MLVWIVVWIMGRADEKKRLEAFEIWIWGIQLKDKVTNVSVFKSERRSMLNTVGQTKHRRLGRVVRSDVLLQKNYNYSQYML